MTRETTETWFIPLTGEHDRIVVKRYQDGDVEIGMSTHLGAASALSKFNRAQAGELILALEEAFDR